MIKRTSRTAIFATCLTLGLALVITYLTLIMKGGGSSSSGFDKIAHFLAFAALAYPVALFQFRSLRWALPLMALFGGAIEIIQPYVGRGRELNDFYADLAGLVAGVLLGVATRKVWDLIARRSANAALEQGAIKE